MPHDNINLMNASTVQVQNYFYVLSGGYQVKGKFTKLSWHESNGRLVQFTLMKAPSGNSSTNLVNFLNKEIYMIGGTEQKDKSVIYDIGCDSWGQGPMLNEERYANISYVQGSFVYTYGGFARGK